MLVLTLLLSCFSFGCGDDTLGLALDLLTMDVDTFIDEATNAGRILAVEAGGQVLMTIESARRAYADSLDTTLNRLDALTTKKLQELRTMIAELQTAADAAFEKISRDAQQIANTLPFANTEPQLTRYSPAFISPIPSEEKETQSVQTDAAVAVGYKGQSSSVPIAAANGWTIVPGSLKLVRIKEVGGRTQWSFTEGSVPGQYACRFSFGNTGLQMAGWTTLNYYFTYTAERTTYSAKTIDQTVIVAFDGNFPDAKEEDFTPWLELDGEELQPVEVTTQKIAFEVPVSITDGLTSLKARLHVPFEGGFWIFGGDKEAVFRIVLSVLPVGGPGRVVFTRTIDTAQQDRVHVVTPRMICSGRNGDTGWVPYQYALPDPGYRIDAKTVRFVVDSSHGKANEDWEYRPLNLGECVAFAVRAFYRTWTRPGYVDFHFEYDQVREKVGSSTRSEVIYLRWGESRAWKVQPGKWTLTFDCFDGAPPKTFVETDLSHRFLKATVMGDDLTVEAPEPAAIR